MFHSASDFFQGRRTESMGASETGIFSCGHGCVIYRNKDDTHDDEFLVISLVNVKQILYRHRRRKDSIKPYYRGRIGSQISCYGCCRLESSSSVVTVHTQRLPSPGIYLPKFTNFVACIINSTKDNNRNIFFFIYIIIAIIKSMVHGIM